MRLAKDDDSQILTDDDRQRLEEAIFLAIMAGIEWDGLPEQIQPALANAAISGATQMGISGSAAAEAKDAAKEYAHARSAEMIGKTYDEDGDLVPNENAEWSISETTENKIRELVHECFAESMTFAEAVAAIEDALVQQAEGGGIFSESRATLIAENEVARAQAYGQLSAWTAAGVKKIRWITASDELVCPSCGKNDGEVVKIGNAFSSGAIHPPDHPRCRCSLTVVK
jgi:SPP1 gp7 family putative phage head morphogenesis protein